WDTATGKQLLCLEGHQGPVTSVAFSPDGRHIVSGSEDKTVRVWDADTGLTSFEFKGHKTPVRSVAFSPDGKRVGSVSPSSANGEVIVWATFTGEIYLKEQKRVWTSIAFSPDGKRVAAGECSGARHKEYSVVIWDLSLGGNVSWFAGHRDVITQVA